MRYFIPVALIICLVIVCLPCFNHKKPMKEFLNRSVVDSGPQIDERGDADQYSLMVKQFRGESIEGIEATFGRRILPPLLASLLPFDPITSINILNIIYMLGTIFILYRILELTGSSYNFRIIGCLMFIFSFPTFWYGTIGYIDPLLLLLITAAVFCVLSEKWHLIIPILLFGILTKVTILGIMPFVIAGMIIKSKSRGFVIIVTLVCMTTVVFGYLLASSAIPYFQESDLIPHIDKFMLNMARPRCPISIILSFGLPGFLTLIAWKRNDTLLAIGAFAIIITAIVAVFSAYGDGRAIWMSYPFTIPLAVKFMEDGLVHKGREHG